MELFLVLGARYYSPTTGRFVQKDAYKGDTMQPATLNRYAYCQGNPVMYADPSGYLVVRADVDAAYNKYMSQVDITKAYYESYSKAKNEYNKLSGFQNWIESELRKVEQAYYRELRSNSLRIWLFGNDLSPLKDKMDALSATLVNAASLASKSSACHEDEKRKFDESLETQRQLWQDYKDVLELYDRKEIYDRMANMRQYKGKNSEALGILKTIMEDVNTLGMSTTELMIQYALQFTGKEEKDLDNFSNIESHEKLKYDTASGNSFDKYDDCSGFVQELYYVFFDVKLGYEDGKNITSGGVDHQFNNIDANGQNYLIETNTIDDDTVQPGQLIYYDYNGSSNPTKNAWDSDHVVMSLGLGWVIAESSKGKGVTVSQLDKTHVVGYTQNIQNRK